MDEVTQDQAASMTARAIAALGAGRPGDYVLHLASQAASLPEDAGPLKRILQRENIQAIGATFDTADTKAVAAQRQYKWLARFASYAGFASVAVALLLFCPSHGQSNDREFAAGYLLEISLVIASFAASYLIAHTQSFNIWMSERALAESMRAKLFGEVAKSTDEVKAGETALLPLQLEYVRRYQLDVQTAFYIKRGIDHKTAAARLAKLRYLVVIFLIVGVVPLLYWLATSGGILTEIWERAFHSFGLLAGALQTLIATHEEQAHNARNAGRYESTGNNLLNLSQTPLEAARAAAALGDRATVMTFINKLHQQLSREHSEWLVAHQIDPNKPLDQLQSVPANS
jgi:hypothetical protein